MPAHTAPTTPFGLQVSDLSGGPNGHTVLHKLSFSWPAGLSWICGDEGSGKTSLLRLLAGDLLAMQGHVQTPAGGVFWVDLSGPAHDEATVRDCWAQLQSQYPEWHSGLQQDLCEVLSMTPHTHKRLNMLSTGSRRKVMLVAALACGATVTLLDQPFASLDHASIHALKDFLREVAGHPNRAWLVADYQAPTDLPLASVLQL